MSSLQMGPKGSIPPSALLISALLLPQARNTRRQLGRLTPLCGALTPFPAFPHPCVESENVLWIVVAWW